MTENVLQVTLRASANIRDSKIAKQQWKYEKDNSIYTTSIKGKRFYCPFIYWKLTFRKFYLILYSPWINTLHRMRANVVCLFRICHSSGDRCLNSGVALVLFLCILSKLEFLLLVPLLKLLRNNLNLLAVPVMDDDYNTHNNSIRQGRWRRRRCWRWEQQQKKEMAITKSEEEKEDCL